MEVQERFRSMLEILQGSSSFDISCGRPWIRSWVALGAIDRRGRLTLTVPADRSSRQVRHNDCLHLPTGCVAGFHPPNSSADTRKIGPENTSGPMTIGYGIDATDARAEIDGRCTRLPWRSKESAIGAAPRIEGRCRTSSIAGGLNLPLDGVRHEGFDAFRRSRP